MKQTMLSKLNKSITLLMPMVLFSSFVFSEVYETEWIQSETGYQEDSLGFTLQNIEEVEEAEEQKVTLQVTEEIYNEISDVEEVVVYGKPLEEQELSPIKIRKKVRTEFIKNADEDYYGLIIYLDKDQKWPLRLYIDAEQGEPGE